MKWGFRFKAIAWGVGIDFATSLLSGFLLGIGFLIFFYWKHPEVHRLELAEWLRASLLLKIAGTSSGIFCSFLGGMVAANLAPAYELRNTVATGLCGVLLSAAVMALLPADPLYTARLARIAAWAATPIAAVLGGLALVYWRRRKTKE